MTSFVGHWRRSRARRCARFSWGPSPDGCGPPKRGVGSWRRHVRSPVPLQLIGESSARYSAASARRRRGPIWRSSCSFCDWARVSMVAERTASCASWRLSWSTVRRSRASRRLCHAARREALDLEPVRERFGELSGFAGPVRPATLGSSAHLRGRPGRRSLSDGITTDLSTAGDRCSHSLPGSSRWFMRSACEGALPENVAGSVAARLFLRFTVARTFAGTTRTPDRLPYDRRSLTEIRHEASTLVANTNERAASVLCRRTSSSSRFG